MADTPLENGASPASGPDEDRVTLLHHNGSYWLFEGIDHIDNLLNNNGNYPKPVRCLTFNSMYDVNMYISGRATLSDLWTVHPAIVERLRHDQELEDIGQPQA